MAKIERSSGNVFLDLGFSRKEAAKLLRESDMSVHFRLGRLDAARQIARHAERLGKTCESNGLRAAAKIAKQIAGMARRLA